MAQQQKSARSPYVKYHKAPTAYSAQYQQWKAAVIRGVGVREAAAAHDRAFGIYSFSTSNTRPPRPLPRGKNYRSLVETKIGHYTQRNRHH